MSYKDYTLDVHCDLSNLICDWIQKHDVNVLDVPIFLEMQISGLKRSHVYKKELKEAAEIHK